MDIIKFMNLLWKLVSESSIFNRNLHKSETAVRTGYHFSRISGWKSTS
jgi:hypothetical protein